MPKHSNLTNLIMVKGGNLMKSRETKIPQFYDVLDDEIFKVRNIYKKVLDEAKRNGFLEIETSAIELKDRYINATEVHFSKIFEVKRPKQGSQFALQADLAMSMSRFIADLPTDVPTVKLVQLGKMYRDRIPNLPGYRREFKQILLGVWGEASLFADAELIYLAWSGMKAVSKTKILYIEISNQNILNAINEGLAEKVRFEGVSIIESEDLDEKDKELICNAFEKEVLTFSEVEVISNQISNDRIKSELKKMILLYKFIKEQYMIDDQVYFSFKNLEGTGHYSGLHYRIYLEIEGKKYLIGDGGRIDTLCSKFNSNKNIPAVCMGIGIQVLAQAILDVPKEQIAILIDEKNIRIKWDLIQEIKKSFSEFVVSIIPKRPEKMKKFFKSEFYENYTFILIDENSIEVRSNNRELKEKILQQLENFVSITA